MGPTKTIMTKLGFRHPHHHGGLDLSPLCLFFFFCSGVPLNAGDKQMGGDMLLHGHWGLGLRVASTKAARVIVRRLNYFVGTKCLLMAPN